MEALQTLPAERVASTSTWPSTRAGHWLARCWHGCSSAPGRSRALETSSAPAGSCRRQDIFSLALWPVTAGRCRASRQVWSGRSGPGGVARGRNARLATHARDGTATLLPGGELLVVLLGLLTPCLLAYGVVRHPLRRLVLALGCGSVGVTAALSRGAELRPGTRLGLVILPVQLGLVAGGVLAVACSPCLRAPAPCCCCWRWRSNKRTQIIASAAFICSRPSKVGVEGRFIRFHGLAQWVGWRCGAGVEPRCGSRAAEAPLNRLCAAHVDSFLQSTHHAKTPRSHPGQRDLIGHAPSLLSPAHLFLPLNGRRNGRSLLRPAPHGNGLRPLQAAGQAAGLAGPGQVRVNRAGCMDRCAAARGRVVLPGSCLLQLPIWPTRNKTLWRLRPTTHQALEPRACGTPACGRLHHHDCCRAGIALSRLSAPEPFQTLGSLLHDSLVLHIPAVVCCWCCSAGRCALWAGA